MRAVLRIVSAVLAAALLVFGALAVLEIVRATTHHSPSVLHWRAVPDTLARNSWADGGPRLAGFLATGIGLLLLLLAARRGKPAALELSRRDDSTEMLATRSGVRRSLERAAEDVDGVERATVHVGRRRANVSAVSGVPEPVEERVRQTVEERLNDLELARPLRVKVSARTAS